MTEDNDNKLEIDTSFRMNFIALLDFIFDKSISIENYSDRKQFDLSC